MIKKIVLCTLGALVLSSCGDIAKKVKSRPDDINFAGQYSVDVTYNNSGTLEESTSTLTLQDDYIEGENYRQFVVSFQGCGGQQLFSVDDRSLNIDEQSDSVRYYQVDDDFEEITIFEVKETSSGLSVYYNSLDGCKVEGTL